MRLRSTTDPHTYHGAGEPVPLHVDLDIEVDFGANQLHITQVTQFDKSGIVHLDSRGQCNLVLEGRSAFNVRKEDSVLGSCVTLTVPKDRTVAMQYSTSPTALGLQWLTPQQADSKLPLVYSQGETINGRSILILPDSPSIRFTYNVKVKVPKELHAVMAAGTYVSRVVKGDWAIEQWEMKTPVPLYLFAVNIGEFEFAKLDEQCGVWANPRILYQATEALRQTPVVLAAEEKLFGPYLWGTYSTIVLPQRGFPFGAMEHPCMTSMNAMLMSDQYAATRVTIHEMVHSWFGNLITNASWEDFWLNEGVTSFGEWLAIREVLGVEAMLLQIAISMEELRHAIATFMADGKPEYTHLKLRLSGINPDDSFSRVAYIKGALFLWAIMERVGEEAMLQFLRDYIATYRFTSITTEEFLRFVADKLGQSVLDDVGVQAWVYGPGLPANTPRIVSEKILDIEGHATLGWFSDKKAAEWSSQEWVLYLSKLSRKGPSSFLRDIDTRFGLSTSSNGMLQFEFLRAALETENCPVSSYQKEVRGFLLTYGRNLYLLPLYRALCERGDYQTALQIFNEARAGYHPLGQAQVEKLLARYAPTEVA